MRLSGEHYFDTHDVAGRTVTRTRKLSLSKFGYERPKDKPQSISVKEVTIPVYDESGLTVVRALEYELPYKKDKEKSPKPELTMIGIGGGSSEAVGNVALIGRIEDGLDSLDEELSFRVAKIILLPHVTGSVGTETKKGKKDLTDHETLTTSAKILEKALADPELKISPEGIIFFGYSAGGAQAIELAGLYGDECKYLLLADSAGMAEHPQLEKEFSLTVWSAFKKYRQKGKSMKEAFREAFQEIRTAWVTPKGKPSTLGLVREFLFPDREVNKLLAKAYGFSGEQRREGVSVGAIKTDSTHQARQKVTAEVIFSPIILAKAVNVITARMKDKYPDIKAIKQAGEELKQDVLIMLREMFPKAKKVHFAGYDEMSHSSVMSDQKYWEQLMTKLG